jgi:hypothetical protein
MHTVATALFALAGIVGLTPALALLTFWHRFPSWLDDLSKYETLLGTLMFAAALALIGAVLTSWNHRSISNRQIAAERRKQELALRPEKQQIASALIGEIDVIVNKLHHESLRSAIETPPGLWKQGQEKSRSMASASTLGTFLTTVQPSLYCFPAAFPKG